MPNEHTDETTAQVIRAITFPRYVMAVLVQMVAAHGVSIGLALLAGGDARISGPTSVMVAAVAPSLVWGLAYVLAGACLALVGWKRPRWALPAGLVLAVMHGFFAGALFAGVLAAPAAMMTGWVNYAWLAAFTTTIAVHTSWISRSWPR